MGTPIGGQYLYLYITAPFELLKTYGTTSVVGFAMFICGILSVAMFQQVESEAILGMV